VRRNRRVLDLSQNGFDGMPIGNWRAEPPEEPSSEQGTFFNGESYIEPDRKPSINVLTGFSVEAWAKPAGGPSYRAIFSSRWVYDSHTPSQQCFGYTLYAGDSNRWEFWTGPGRLGYFWSVIESPEEIDEALWTHVVGTYTPGNERDSERVRGVSCLYVDGKLSIENEQEASLTDFEWPARIGAAEFVPRYLTSWLYKGHLRDVAIYDYPLEPQRVAVHHRKGEASEIRQLSQLPHINGLLIASSLENEKK
jgi:Concanavalin A-like lectin/glucanases superfamily